MSWALLRETRPALFDDAVALLSERHGYAFLATTAADGSPRVHPVAPIVTPTGVHLAISAGSPKLRDLRRDPRLALHSSVRPPSDDELSVRGRAVPVRDEHRRRTVERERICGAELHDSMVLLDLVPERVVRTTWRDGSSSRQVWSAGRG